MTSHAPAVALLLITTLVFTGAGFAANGDGENLVAVPSEIQTNIPEICFIIVSDPTPHLEDGWDNLTEIVEATPDDASCPEGMITHSHVVAWLLAAYQAAGVAPFPGIGELPAMPDPDPLRNCGSPPVPTTCQPAVVADPCDALEAVVTLDCDGVPTDPCALYGVPVLCGPVPPIPDPCRTLAPVIACDDVPPEPCGIYPVPVACGPVPVPDPCRTLAPVIACDDVPPEPCGVYAVPVACGPVPPVPDPCATYGAPVLCTDVDDTLGAVMDFVPGLGVEVHPCAVSGSGLGTVDAYLLGAHLFGGVGAGSWNTEDGVTQVTGSNVVVGATQTSANLGMIYLFNALAQPAYGSATAWCTYLEEEVRSETCTSVFWFWEKCADTVSTVNVEVACSADASSRHFLNDLLGIDLFRVEMDLQDAKGLC